MHEAPNLHGRLRINRQLPSQATEVKQARPSECGDDNDPPTLGQGLPVTRGELADTVCCQRRQESRLGLGLGLGLRGIFLQNRRSIAPWKGACYTVRTRYQQKIMQNVNDPHIRL